MAALLRAAAYEFASPGAAVDDPRVAPVVRALLAVWIVLLIPWVIFAMLSPMAFDNGYTTAANIFVWTTLLYPVPVATAWLLRRKAPFTILLPVPLLIIWWIAGSAH